MNPQKYSFLLFLLWAQITANGQLKPSLEKNFANEIDVYQTQIKKNPGLIEARLALAKIYLQIESFQLAINQYHQILSISSDHLNVYYGLGLSYSGQAKFRLAVESFLRELKVRLPNNMDKIKNCAHIYAALGSAYAGLYQYTEAEVAYQKALQLAPNDAMIHHQFGNIIKKQGNDYELIIKHQRKATAIDPRLASAHLQLGLAYSQVNQWSLAITSYNKAITLDTDLVEAEYNLALAYLRLGDQDKAQEHLDHFQRKKSAFDQIARLKGAFERSTNLINQAQISANIGQAYLKQKQYQKSIQYYQKSIGLDPKSAISYNGIGIAYAMLKRYDLAITNQKKSIEIQPDLAEAQAALGLIYLRQNKLNLALSAYQKSVELKPNLADAQQQIGLIHLGQKSYIQAELSFRKALEIDSLSADNYHNLGLSLAYQDKMKAAIDVYLQAIKLRPDSEIEALAESHFLLAEAYNQSSDEKAAEKYYLQAVKINDRLAKAFHAIAQLYGSKKVNLEKAIQQAKRAVKLEPKNAIYYNTLALLHYLLKQYDFAQSAIQMALKLDPDNQSYQMGFKQIRSKMVKK